MASFKYSLQQIHDIGTAGFQFTIPENVINILMSFAAEIGNEYSIPIRPTFDSTNVFKTTNFATPVTNSFENSSGRQNRKRRNNNREISDEEWNSFQTTKIEQRVGIDANIDKIKLSLNKISDKTFLTMRENILNELDFIYSQHDILPEDNDKLCNIIYTLLSSNKFYSRIFAELYCELITKYPAIKHSFEQKMNFSTIIEQYTNINYTSPDENYDLFCANNKQNQVRQSLSTFYVNLARNGMIGKDQVGKLLKEIMCIICTKINEPDNKNIIDELSENVAILYNREILNEIDEDDDEFLVNDKTIEETITDLSQANLKNYLSLSNKAKFKFMDIIDA